MWKLMGCLCVVGAACWSGLAPVMALRRRIAVLEALSASLPLLRAELTSLLTPLPELFTRLGEQSSGRAAELYRTLGEGLYREPTRPLLSLMREQLPALELGQGENSLLLDLAGTLGGYDLESQKRMLDAVQARLDYWIGREREKLATSGRTWGVLGVCGGVALTILLV